MTDPSIPAPRDRPVRGTALAFGIGVGALALVASFFFLPVEWGEARLRFRFWRAGARTVLWEKHRGFTVDRCGGRAPAECECVWLIHGLGDSLATWRSFFLDAEAFGSRPVRIFAIDLPGHGGSLRRRDLNEYRVSNMARELDEGVSRTSECVKNTLIGNSFGGWVVTRMILESPSRYGRLILISPSGTADAIAATQDLLRDASVASLQDFQRRAYFRPRVLSSGEWSAAVARAKSGVSNEVRLAQIAADRLDERLGNIHVKTSLIWGEADRVIPPENRTSFTRHLTLHEFFLIPECGHLPQKECPEKLLPLLRRIFGPGERGPHQS